MQSQSKLTFFTINCEAFLFLYHRWRAANQNTAPNGLPPNFEGFIDDTVRMVDDVMGNAQIASCHELQQELAKRVRATMLPFTTANGNKGTTGRS